MRIHKVALVAVCCLALLLIMHSAAVACPTCKEGLAANDPTHAGIVRGYFWSIVFMMSMPFTILAGVSAYFYYEVCRARRLSGARTAAPAPAISGRFAPAAEGS